MFKVIAWSKYLITYLSCKYFRIVYTIFFFKAEFYFCSPIKHWNLNLMLSNELTSLCILENNIVWIHHCIFITTTCYFNLVISRFFIFICQEICITLQIHRKLSTYYVIPYTVKCQPHISYVFCLLILKWVS